MITSIETFTGYFEGIRRRTMRYVEVLPADRVDWSPKDGEYTCGDIVRHVTATELMFVGAVVEGRWLYQGHNRAEGENLDSILTRLQTGHTEAMNALSTLDDAVLVLQRPSLEGTPVKAWRLLMAMVEHEVHHRSQLASYLSLLGIQPPHIYGLGVEDVIARATG